MPRSIRSARRPAAVNLLMPFVRAAHIDVRVSRRIDVAVVAFGGDAELVERLRESGAVVFVMVGTGPITLILTCQPHRLSWSGRDCGPPASRRRGWLRGFRR